MTDVPPLGPTGRFPDGKLDKTDEGEIALRVSSDPISKLVRLDFGKPVEWLAFPPHQAIELARALFNHAGAARGFVRDDGMGDGRGGDAGKG